MDAARIDNDFGFHPATAVTGPKHDEVRLLCRTLAHDLNELLPEGRHKSLAISNLESVMHRANAAIACDTPPPPRTMEGAECDTRPEPLGGQIVPD